jgi:LPS O-antigen subunit length determinant protein (WzzB/FepE family)
MSSNERNDINPYENEPNLKEIVIALIDQKKVILMITMLFALSSIVFSMSVSKKWYSSTLMSSISSNGGGGSTKTSGLASMVGMGAQEDTKIRAHRSL